MSASEVSNPSSLRRFFVGNLFDSVTNQELER